MSIWWHTRGSKTPMQKSQNRKRSWTDASADLRVRRLDLFDPDALSEAVANGSLEHQQMQRGAFQGALLAREIGDCVVNAGRHNRTLLARGEMPPGAVVLGAVLQARESGRINGFRFGPRDLICCPAASELDYILPAETQWVALQLPLACIDELIAADETIRAVLMRTHVWPASWPGTASIVQLMECLLAPGLGPPAPVRCDQEALLAGLRQLGASSDRATALRPRTSLAERMRLLRRFETVVRDRLAAPLRIPAICEELGVKQRTLEQVFQEQLGVSPYRHVQLLRLHAAHRDLLAGRALHDGIAAVASASGFAQPGRFSVHYRAHFGEPPSATAARRMCQRSAGASGAA